MGQCQVRPLATCRPPAPAHHSPITMRALPALALAGLLCYSPAAVLPLAAAAARPPPPPLTTTTTMAMTMTTTLLRIRFVMTFFVAFNHVTMPFNAQGSRLVPRHHRHRCCCNPHLGRECISTD